jgi:hypothetical protein
VKPIVVVVGSGDGLGEAAEAGACRSGGPEVSVARFAELPPLPPEADVAVIEGIEGAAPAALAGALSSGATAVVVLELERSGSDPRPTESWLELVAGAPEVTIAVPVVPDEARRALWDALRAARLEETHHLVEVDGSPAVEELRERGVAVEPGDMRLLAAGAAGVLAGRLAARGKAWER